MWERTWEFDSVLNFEKIQAHFENERFDSQQLVLEFPEPPAYPVLKVPIK